MSLYPLLRRAVDEFAERPLIICDGATRTYSEVDQSAMALAESLARLGIKAGARVAIYLPNSADFAICVFAVGKLGAVPVPISTRFKAREIRHIIEDAGISCVLSTANPAGPIDLLGRLRDTVTFVDAGEQELVNWFGYELTPTICAIKSLSVTAATTQHAEGAEGIGLILYTSGTTARAKGCPLRSTQLIHNAESAAGRYGLKESDVFWDPLPLFHIGGIMHFLAVVHVGAAFLTASHFQADEALRDIARYRATYCYPAFPTLTERLIAAGGIGTDAPHSPRAVMTLGSAEFLLIAQAAFPQARVLAAYGSTELNGTVISPQLDDPADVRLRSCGLPFPGVQVRIVDPTTLRPVAASTIGEITISGDCVFDGYLNSAAVNAVTIVDGWLRTGDSGWLDEGGYLHYNGRLKDMFKVGGESVSPEEIVGLLLEHPAVRLAVVVGVPDENYGEVAAAFVEAATGISEAELIGYCTAQLASYKVPRYVRFVDEWPMSDTKIRTDQLKDQLIAELSIR